MVQKNPFSITFGRPPSEYIMRDAEYEMVMDTFTGEPITDQIFIITGVRGTGKTVLLSSLVNDFEEKNDWIVISLNTSENMTSSFYSDLYYKLKIKDVKVDAEFSLPGVKISVASGAPEITLRTKIEKLLRIAEKHNKKVIVALDEVSDSEELKYFIKTFQEMISKELPLFFIGTAIFENIDSLRNAKDMTFLYRAPRIVLEPLSIIEMARKYEDIFEVPREESLRLAKLTKGYPFAFQALGYVLWNCKSKPDKSTILDKYDRLLGERAYSKLWQEMSDLDRLVCRGIAYHNGDRVKEIRDEIDMDPKKFNVYRLRLNEKGLININNYGKISFVLPRFSEFVITISELYEI